MEIELRNIHKAFGSNEVLKGVDLKLKSGEVHALMGENGAGKSTLMNILTGIHKQDKGQIFVDGKEISFKNPLEAEAYGIAFIHQELNIWPNLSILENLFLMHSVTNGMGILDFKAMRAMAEQKCREIEIELPLDMEAGECSVGQQQMTEIVRNLLLDAKVVIMDEPTAALTERETEKLFEVMRSLKKRGVAMVYISHRMEEVTQNCDTITVMRDGVSVATKPVKEYSMEQIVRDMVGRSITEFYPDRRNKPGEVLLASGRGAFIEPTDHLAREPWLAVAELGGGDARDRIRLAAGLDTSTLESDLAHLIEVEDRLAREPSGKPVIRRIRRIGALVLDEKVVGAPDRAAMTAALKSEIEAGGLGALKWGEQAGAIRARLAFLRGLDEAWPDVSDEGLLAAREDWLWPLLDGARSLADIGDGRLAEALRGLIPWDLQRRLDELAPTRLTTPLGSAGVDYAAEGGPRVEIRVQELFGVKTHPTVGGGRIPLTLSLLSPARRPVQVTKDLPGFWSGSWAAVRSEMRGRYPRHPWPEDPANAAPTNRAKPRGT